MPFTDISVSNPNDSHTAGAEREDAPYAQTAGNPISFVSGPFEGRTIRAELQELQKAELGRKYARVDRRPLDPPPVVRLRLFDIQHEMGGQDLEREVSYKSGINVGIMCTVDLFPVPDSLYTYNESEAHRDEHAPSTSSRGHGIGCTDPFTFFPLHPFTTPDASGSQRVVTPFQIPRRKPMLGKIEQSDIPTDVVHRIGNHYVTESSKLTPALVGEKFVEASLVDYNGQKALLFVFGDVAVQREGTFIFRYRAYDIFSTTANSTPDRPLLAELFGGAFKVYSTREFPGLMPSTDLTRNLANYGIRVALRDTERKPKRNREQTASAMSSGS